MVKQQLIFTFPFFPASLVDNCDASSNNCVPIEYSGPGVRASRLVSPWPVSVSATLVNNGKEIGIQSGTSSGRSLPLTNYVALHHCLN